MALSATTLADELKSMELYSDEASAASAWAASYRAYMEDATSNGIPIVAASLVAAESAMVAGLSGLSTAGATALQTGIQAFWGAIIPAVAWPTVTAITPPVLLAGLSAALTTVFAANIAGSLSKDASMTSIANTIHTNSLGGIAAWPAPPTGAGPQPIL